MLPFWPLLGVEIRGPWATTSRDALDTRGFFPFGVTREGCGCGLPALKPEGFDVIGRRGAEFIGPFLLLWLPLMGLEEEARIPAPGIGFFFFAYGFTITISLIVQSSNGLLMRLILRGV